MSTVLPTLSARTSEKALLVRVFVQSTEFSTRFLIYDVLILPSVFRGMLANQPSLSLHASGATDFINRVMNLNPHQNLFRGHLFHLVMSTLDRWFRDFNVVGYPKEIGVYRLDEQARMANDSYNWKNLHQLYRTTYNGAFLRSFCARPGPASDFFISTLGGGQRHYTGHILRSWLQHVLPDY